MSNLLNKYKNLSPAIKASIWFMICSFIQKGISFFVVPVYTRILTTEEYGMYSVYLSWVNILYIFATLNMSAGVFNNGMIKYENYRDQFTSAIQGLSSVISIIFICLLILLKDQVSIVLGLDAETIILMMIQIFFNASYNYWIARQRFDFKYKCVVLATLLIACVTPLLAIILLNILEDKCYAIIIGTVAAQVIIGGILYIINFYKGKVFFELQIWKYCAKFNFPLIPHYLSYVVLGQADRVMINNICGSANAGIYSLAYQMSIVINMVTNAIDGSFNPWTYQKLKEKNYKSIKKVSNYLILIYSVFVLGIVLIAPEIMRIVAPPEYYDAIWVVPPVVAGCFFMFLAGSFMRVEFFHERNKLIMFASITAAVFNIILNAIFIPIFGFIAAAYTTLGSYFLFSIFHYFAMVDTCKKNGYAEYPFEGKTIFVIAGLITIIAIALMLCYKNVLIRYAIILIMISVVFIFRNKIKGLIIMLRNRGN